MIVALDHVAPARERARLLGERARRKAAPRSSARRIGEALDSSAESVRRSSIRRCMRFGLVVRIMPRKRRRCALLESWHGSSASVSTKPVSTVTGVFSSCDTLATKSRRMVSRRSCAVTSRELRSFRSSPNSITRTDSTASIAARERSMHRLAEVAAAPGRRRSPGGGRC